MKKMNFNKVAMVVNIGLFLILSVTSLCFGRVAGLVGALPLLVYALFFGLIDKKDQQISRLADSNIELVQIGRRLLDDCVRYEKLYGKLPEEPKNEETNESERTDESKD